MHHRYIAFLFALMLTCVPAAHAQLGPRPNEIPVSGTQGQGGLQPQSALIEAVDEESKSAQARPAIDALLIARARGDEQVASTEPAMDTTTPVSHSLQDDLRASETLPPLEQGQPERLIGASEAQQESSGFGSIDKGWVQTAAALSGVLLLIMGLSQLFKRLARSQGGLVGQIGAGGSAPTGILEVIGRYPLGTGMTLVVLKFDRRVLLVANSGATRGKHARGATMQTLCELSDPEDVASILLKARSASGESIAQSFERALQDADDLTDESIYGYDEPVRPAAQVHLPKQQHAPVRTITSDEGDRAELWSTGATGQAAAGVLRKRLATMRREQRDT
ncbi:MAG: hypothetical protein CMJ35_12805 [Phycisphaerae bacterium]|nr:hypothetical protein [Phycisphaerae bacterium]MBM92473.1 hypothetical protein [Phycisphaerae bacterium]HCT45489.1 hypothetical protein [Phycisphaerales bacterium]